MPGHATGSSNLREAGIDKVLNSEIARYGATGSMRLRDLMPWFDPAVERRFEADIRASRLHEINITVGLGIFFYFLTVLTDFAFIPDIGLLGLAIRLLPLPLLFGTMLVAPRLACSTREWTLAAVGVITIMALAVLPILSTAPLASMAFYPPMLAVIYGNTTVVARFGKSLAYTTVCCLGISILALFHTGFDSPVGWGIGLLALITGGSGLVANYRAERSARLAYLLNTREALRLAAAAADREKLRALSNTDALTGLANRGSFDQRGAAAFADQRNRGRSATLLMLDIDHFKSFNDFYGHIAGDDCLRAVANRIAQVVRADNDIAARYGGEEFVVFLLGTSQEQAEGLAQRICDAVRALEIPHEARVDALPWVTISIGVATVVIDAGVALEDLIDAADRALYAAKNAGRDRYRAAFNQAA